MPPQIDRFIPVTKLKYYFAVDTVYVGKKLGLLVFPYLHQVSTTHRSAPAWKQGGGTSSGVLPLSQLSPQDWEVQYQQDTPVAPRFDINAPDLYIPGFPPTAAGVVWARCLGA